jgi:hypothetical protein
MQATAFDWYMATPCLVQVVDCIAIGCVPWNSNKESPSTRLAPLSQSLSLPHLGHFSLGRGLLCGGCRYLCMISRLGIEVYSEVPLHFSDRLGLGLVLRMPAGCDLCSGRGRCRCITNAPVIWHEVAKRSPFSGDLHAVMDCVLHAAPIVYPTTHTHGCCASLLVHSTRPIW